MKILQKLKDFMQISIHSNNEHITHCNILVVGQTGFGKSSLINYIIGKNEAKIGVGRPVTSKDDMSSFQTTYHNVLLTLFDSWGIETDKVYDWTRRIKSVIKKCNDTCVDKGVSWFHTILYCIACDKTRIQDLDIEMIKFFKNEGYSVVVVFTKADLVDDKDIITLSKLLPAETISVSVSVGVKTHYSKTAGFGKEQLFSAMLKETLKNLPRRTKIYADAISDVWKKEMFRQLDYKDISRFGNSDIEAWINSNAATQAKILPQKINDFINKETDILSQWSKSSSQTEEMNFSWVSLPEYKSNLSGGEIALLIALGPITLLGGALYGLICGVEDEKKKLREMISQATQQMYEYSQKRCDSLKDCISKTIS